ncbi:Receptor-like protein 15 [Citrus sinensis]|nr:Receptor-like protein 15 [Citrus sinensis]
MMELFESLGVDMEISDMSFSLSLDKGQGCEWGSRNGWSSLFAQKKNVLNPYFWQMLREMISSRMMSSGCTVVCGDGSREFYNSCVMALHAPDALKILGNQATFDECSLLTSFQQLESLHLENNNIAGFVENGELDSMSNLKVLDMGMNEIEDFSVRPKDYRILRKLYALVLDDVTIRDGNKFLQAMGSFPSLKTLSLKSSNFTRTVNSQESESSHSMTPKFQLESVALSGSGIHATFPKFLYNQHDLEYVDFSDSNLKGEFLNWLLENNTNLNTLVLRNNSLSGPFRMPIQPHWHLDTLYVSKNFFQGNIPLEIGVYFPRLVYLNLSRNDFNGSIPSSIGDMNSLEALDLSHNQLTGEIPEHLAMSCFNLEFLVLSENSLLGQLFSKKNYLRKLVSLHLDANYFTGEIPKSLSNCSHLEGLYMSDNNLYGNIPAWLGNLSSLYDIMMASNHLQGPIPLEFCQLNYLQILDLSENNISGSLPSCSSHSSITQVHLSKNMLYGPLRYGTFFNRSSIVTLDLSYNSFSGYIPYWIERLTYLRYLILANNNLEGEVPIQLCRLKQLRLIDLSNNNIFGQIPGCLDNTSLHNNGDNDDSLVPAFNHNVRSTYSAGSSTMEKEESIMFTTKEISFSYKGKPLNKMYGVDLSCNKLTGEIPPQISKLTRIRALNLSHNNLTGVIPVTFSNLNQVESLDISYNNLNGKIPPQLVELNALAFFSVAHNNLSGKIPEWTAQFTTFKEDSYEGNPLLCGKPLPDCDVAAVPEASNEEDGNSLIDMGSFYITFTSSYVIVILAIIGVLYVNPYWHRRWFYLIENWMTSCFYFIIDNLIPTRFYHACMQLHYYLV